jgi:hypothetical protein
MKVLMTGMSARSVGSERVRYDYTTLPQIYAAALRELGHEIDMRVTVPGEHLDQYDRALVLVNWISSLSTPHSAKVGVALAELGDRAVLYVDDWRSATVGDDIYGHMVVEKGWLHHRSFRHNEYDRLTSTEQDVARASLSSLASPGCPWSVLVALYDWGSHEFFIGKHPLSAPLMHLDPTSITPAPELSTKVHRERAWSLATFQDPSRWVKHLSPTWRVVQHGGDKKLPGGGSIDKYKLHPVVTEAELWRDYATLRGMLTPPYATDGAGWWRARYVHALASGCIVHAPELDGVHMGPAFTNLIEDVERAEDYELDLLAERQREQTLERTWTRHKTMSALDVLVRTGKIQLP